MDDDTDDGWDLHAVVRGCTAPPLPARPNPTLSPPDSSFDFLNYNQNNNNYNNSHTGGGSFQDLQDAYREFCGDLPSANPAPTGPGLNVFQPPAQEIMQILRMNNINNGSSQENIQFNNNNNNNNNNPSRINGASSSWSSSPSHNLQPTNPQPIRQRRRKNNQMRIVRHMTQEELSADSWAWRKYGQKPIKGSPFPRNYYRCNTSKGCAARKQVERSSSVDPGVFVVSYTGEHTHSRPNHHRTSGSILAKSSTGGAGTSNNNNNNKLMYRSSSGRFSHGGTGNDDVDMGGEDEEEEDENLYMISNGDDDDDMFYKGFHDSDHDHSSGGGGCGNFYTVPNTGNAHRLRG